MDLLKTNLIMLVWQRKKNPDFTIDGQPRIKGKPFGSWDFTLGA